jgi:hypothetical protein
VAALTAPFRHDCFAIRGGSFGLRAPGVSWRYRVLHVLALAAVLSGWEPRDYANTRFSPDTLVAWIRHPHRFNQVTAMPEMGVGEQEARDIAAYLYTLQ